jgi:hypothetical protein
LISAYEVFGEGHRLRVALALEERACKAVAEPTIVFGQHGVRSLVQQRMTKDESVASRARGLGGARNI